MAAYQPVSQPHSASRSTLPTSGSSYSSSAHSHDDASSRAPLYRPVPRASGLNPRSQHTGESRSYRLSRNSDAIDSISSSTGKKYTVAPAILATYTMDAETDDWLHDSSDVDRRSHKISCSGCLNILTLCFLACALLGLFAGYPIAAHFAALKAKKDSGSFNLGGTNGTGQVPDLDIRGLIDRETPPAAMRWTGQSLDARGRANPQNYHLVFSDEFNEEGRTFWKGDDPYWEAVDIWYGATMDYEWYSPEAINTTGGNLVIMMEEMEINNLNFRSGMLQSWNKFCFQGGYIEFNAMQPGRPDTMGYWPGLWTMGNLGRPGYLGSTEGLWPYSYEDRCDAGILPNQMWTNRTGPQATVDGIGQYSASDPNEGNGRGPKRLSSLPGMRFPACTCSGEPHPGPNRRVSRSAPEIDALEAQIQYRNGRFDSYASQSLQMAPFDVGYEWYEGGQGQPYHIYDEETTRINDYLGGPLQQCASGLAMCPRDGFTDAGQRFVTYGFEYRPDWEQDGRNAFVTWYVDGKPTWSVYGGALGRRPGQDMGQRLVSTEPMTIIMNLAMAGGFQPTRFTGGQAMTFPAPFLIDYVRVYQLDGTDDKITCDPPDHPTANYIAAHPELYYDRELTSYRRSKYRWPKNELTGC
ncbi:beta-glucan synthesis-associated protein [Tilletia horrida]|nr:beta-glucan synthesis-associated protein [Tilletia horrida]